MTNTLEVSKRKSLLVMVATYNEAKNIKPMLDSLRSLPLEFDILVVDDNSPDGTGKIVQKTADRISGIYLLKRPVKMGVGSAHLEGIFYAYKNNYKKLLTLDCDFSHDPQLIPSLISAGENYEVVTTNRFKELDGLKTWAPHRRLLTNVAHYLIYIFLGMPYDSTGAFRLYAIDKIPIELFQTIKSKSYSFFWESMYLLWKNKFSIIEKSIKLPARTYGSSKMRLKDIIASLFFLFSFSIKSIFFPKKFIISSHNSDSCKRKNSEKEWDKYWLKKSQIDKDSCSQNLSLYDVVATFYRRYLIRPHLDRHILRSFKPGSLLIHAGCGSGEVDTNLIETMQIKAVDISSPALDIYRSNHSKKAETIRADISSLPFKDGEVDGVYNLGVMEHFSRVEILKILREFRRVTRDGGKVVLFWPPVFGLSVIGLHFIHAFMLYVLKNKNKLHPEEPSKIRSKAAAFKLLKEAGFVPKSWSFGFADLFTYVVLIGEKDESNRL